MGCVASRMNSKEERVQMFRERRRLMKRLLVHRGEFSDALLAYLRALKNTGVTLRQFTESESLDLEDVTPSTFISPPSPPPPLPPSPPPPPFSITVKSKPLHSLEPEIGQQESIEVDGDDDEGTPPPPIASSSWDLWDPFPPLSPQIQEKRTEHMEEEQWAETRTEFEEQTEEMVVDDSKEDSYSARMVAWSGKKTLEGIVKDLDDYFLKASALGKEIAVLVDINSRDAFPPQYLNKRKRNNSEKVFSALLWNWSSKSLQPNQEASDCNHGPGEPCKPGAHCITLEKIFLNEQSLHKEVKEEENLKVEHNRKSSLLQRQEEEMHELTKTDKTRSTVEALRSEIAFKQQSIGRTCTSILTLLDEDLYPQVLALISGLVHMWRTMHECHQVQMQISQQLNCISVGQITDLNSDYHRRAAVQLEAEVESWYRSFCCLIKSQKDYVKTLYGWVQLTNSLTDDQQQRQSSSSSALQRLCDQWLHHLEGAPFQVAWEAIKGLLSAVHSVILQQAQEVDLKKRSDKLEKRLQKELHSLDEMEKRHEAGGHSRASTGTVDGTNSEVLSPKHPLSLKRAKAESLKILAEDGKARYAHSVQVTKAMVLNNLKTALPNAFRAIMEFSGSSAKALEAICGHDKAF